MCVRDSLIYRHRKSPGGDECKTTRKVGLPSRSLRGERASGPPLSRVRDASGGEISPGRSLATRAGESAQTSRRADAPRCAANVMGRGRRCACGHRGDRDRLIALIRPLSLRCACSSVRCPTMEWSGRAPAPPASKAGKGRRREGARDVPETRHYHRHHRHRYRQELVSRGGSRSARTATATTATSCEWKRCANRCAS